MINSSWYFVARSVEVRRGGPRHESVVGDRLLELERGPQGEVRGRLGGALVELRERSSLIFAWLGAGSPSFEVEAFELGGWTPMNLFFLDLPTRPEIVMRDLADVDHFETVHRYVDVDVEREISYVGASFSTQIGFGWDAGLGGRSIQARLRAQVDGLGVQRTEVESLAGLLHSRHLLMPTPLHGPITRVWAGYSVRRGRGPAALREAKARALQAYLGWAFRRDLGRDAALWTGRSAHRPADTERLQRYRCWSGQFSSPATK